jgi:hypothetical protein
VIGRQPRDRDRDPPLDRRPHRTDHRSQRQPPRTSRPSSAARRGCVLARVDEDPSNQARSATGRAAFPTPARRERTRRALRPAPRPDREECRARPYARSEMLLGSRTNAASAMRRHRSRGRAAPQLDHIGSVGFMPSRHANARNVQRLSRAYSARRRSVLTPAPHPHSINGD